MSAPDRPRRRRDAPRRPPVERDPDPDEDPLAGIPILLREPARTYRSLAVTVTLVVAGFVADLLLAGSRAAVAHLPGWLLALAILLGVHALLIHAARVTKSLAVTADELVVGDEAIARGDIVGAVPDREEGDLPTLGWPNGFPRGIKAVTLRLGDGRTVLVPTRRPKQLSELLGITTLSPQQADELTIRVAGEADYAEVAEVAERADTIFRVAGLPLPPRSFDEASLLDCVAVLVAGTPVHGAAQLVEVDGEAHLALLAVLPGAMRRGTGAALLEAACARAAEAGYARVTAVAFADVAWNAPWLRRRGFRDLGGGRDAAGPGLQALLARAPELDAVGPRVTLARPLAGSSDTPPERP